MEMRLLIQDGAPIVRQESEWQRSESAKSTGKRRGWTDKERAKVVYGAPFAQNYHNIGLCYIN